jgi:hypothetical protein
LLKGKTIGIDATTLQQQHLPTGFPFLKSIHQYWSGPAAFTG